MISITEAVESILNSDYVASAAMARGVMNLSSYARDIREKVSRYTKKEVDVQSIVVSLSRLQKGTAEINTATGSIVITQLAVQSPLIQLVYPRTHNTTASLARAFQEAQSLEDSFISVSTSTKDIAVLVSERAEEPVRKSFSQQPLLQKKGLSAVSVRFDERLVKEANVGLELLARLASKRVVLDAALTTYNEFTLVVETKYLEPTIAALSPATQT